MPFSHFPSLEHSKTSDVAQQTLLLLPHSNTTTNAAVYGILATRNEFRFVYGTVIVVSGARGMLLSND